MGNCRSTVIPPLRNHATKDIVVNESEKANALNNYVCSISSTANNIDPPNLSRRTPFSLDVHFTLVKHQAEISLVTKC